MYLPYSAIALLSVWNVIVFAVYGFDKHQSKIGGRRISEKTLIYLAAFFGGLGAFTGMRLFRHKTRHTKFTLGVPLLLALNIVVLAAVSLLRARYLG